MSGHTVAKDIISYCTKCKMDLNHVITAMKGDQVKKVKCHTCGSDHIFRPARGIDEPGGGAPKKKKTRKSAAADTLPISEEWARLMETHKNAPTKNYNMKSEFNLGERLKHPTFGEGIVMKHIFPNKIEVVFETDLKMLIHTPANS